MCAMTPVQPARLRAEATLWSRGTSAHTNLKFGESRDAHRLGNQKALLGLVA